MRIQRLSEDTIWWLMQKNVGADGSKNVYTLFATLTRGISASTPDAAAIRGDNRLQEREALMFSTADEKPQTFLASLKKGGAMDVMVDLPEEMRSGWEVVVAEQRPRAGGVWYVKQATPHLNI